MSQSIESEPELSGEKERVEEFIVIDWEYILLSFLVCSYNIYSTDRNILSTPTLPRETTIILVSPKTKLIIASLY